MKKNIVFIISIVIVFLGAKYSCKVHTAEAIRLGKVVSELKHMLNEHNINFQSRFEEINNEL